jgi:hypothetical protein
LILLEKTEAIIGRHLKVVEEGFARKSKHELADLLKKLNKESEGAVEMIVAIMTKKDQDERLVLQAASKLLDLQRQVAQDINNDKMQRLIANVKYGGPKQLTVEEDETPSINFTDIVELD